ncbi:nucleoside hydrolase [Sutcliffiella cohnii]
MSKKILLDVDTGVDDALAIAYAVASPKIDLLAVTTSYGMAPVDYSYRNTVKVLESLNDATPVYRGSEKPFQRIREYHGKIHGNDGLGETLGDVKEKINTEIDAVDFMIELVKTYREELTIVTTGPLTNLATAIKKAPEIMGLVGRIVTMGGAVATPGNVNKFAEANISIDPEAAELVFKSDLPITLVGLDVTRKTLLTQKDINNWKDKNTDAGDFFATFTQYYLDAYAKMHPYLKGCALHDPLAVGVAMNPKIVKTVPMHITVDLEGDALGRTVEDIHRKEGSNPSTLVSLQVDSEAFMTDFYKNMNNILSSSKSVAERV